MCLNVVRIDALHRNTRRMMQYIMYTLVVGVLHLVGVRLVLKVTEAMDTLVCDSIPLCPSVRRSATSLGPVDVLHSTTTRSVSVQGCNDNLNTTLQQYIY